MSLSIIGCVVNGPGEALMTDVGFTGGGSGHGMVYWAGKQDHKISNMIWSITSSSWSKNAPPRSRPKLRRRSKQRSHFVLGLCAVEAKQRPIARDPAQGPVLDRLSMTKVKISPYPQHVR